MKFCNECKNMYYVTLLETPSVENNTEDTVTLMYYCRHCGNRETPSENETLVLGTSHLPTKQAKFRHLLNPFTKFDPTLPRAYNIPCPNPQCSTHHQENPASSEVLYIRYDNDNLKYLYMCCVCDHTWY